jgi:acetyl-CoA C-acetyltransferase
MGEAFLVGGVRSLGDGGVCAGVAPEVMGLRPVPATEKLLRRHGRGVGDRRAVHRHAVHRHAVDLHAVDLHAVDLHAVQLNEAFATQRLACIRRLGLDREIGNSDGAVIAQAQGHPLGTSSTRILVTLPGGMEREGSRRGLASMCVGVAQGVSLAVEGVL